MLIEEEEEMTSTTRRRRILPTTRGGRRTITTASDENDNANQSNSWKNVLTSVIESTLIKIAILAVKYPKYTILCGILLSTITLSVGISSHFQLETDGYRLWTPKHSTATILHDWVLENSVQNSNSQSVVGGDDGDDTSTTMSPTSNPTLLPSFAPTLQPTMLPSGAPTVAPTLTFQPTTTFSSRVSFAPTVRKVSETTPQQQQLDSNTTTISPSMSPTSATTITPSSSPTTPLPTTSTPTTTIPATSAHDASSSASSSILNSDGFPREGRPIQVIVIHEGGDDDDDSILTRVGMERAFDVTDLLFGSKGNGDDADDDGLLDDDSVDLINDLCNGINPAQQVTGVCKFNSPTLFWDNDRTRFEFEVIHTGSNVGTIITQSIYYPYRGDTVMKHTLLGSSNSKSDDSDDTSDDSDESTTTSIVQAFLITLVIPSPSNDHEADLVMKYELGISHKLFELRDKWSKEEEDKTNGNNNKKFRLEFVTHRSFDDEVLKTIQNDLPFVALAYFLMGTFVALTLKYNNHNSNKSSGDNNDDGYYSLWLGGGAVLTVFLSVMTGYGVAMICNVPFTPLLQIFPYVMVGIGLDDTFIIMGAYSRITSTKPKTKTSSRRNNNGLDTSSTEEVSSTNPTYTDNEMTRLSQSIGGGGRDGRGDGDDYRAHTTTDILHSDITNTTTTTEKNEHIAMLVMKEVGVSIFISTLTTVVSFTLGGTCSSLPALRWFAFYAGPTVMIDFLYQITFFLALVSLDGDTRRRKRINNKMDEDDAKDGDNGDSGTTVGHILSWITIGCGLLLSWIHGIVGKWIDNSSTTNNSRSWLSFKSSIISPLHRGGDNEEDKLFPSDDGRGGGGEKKAHTLHNQSGTTTMMEIFVDTILNGRVCVMVIFITCMSLGIYGTTKQEQEFDYRDLVPPKSHVSELHVAFDTYFESYSKVRETSAVYCYFKHHHQYDHTTTTTTTTNDSDDSDDDKSEFQSYYDYNAMVEFMEQVTNLDFVVDLHPSMIWFEEFNSFQHQQQSQLFIPTNNMALEDQLEVFLTTEPYKSNFASDVIIRNGLLTASRVRIQISSFANNNERVEALKELYEVTQTQPINHGFYDNPNEDPAKWNAFTYGSVYAVWELLIIQMKIQRNGMHLRMDQYMLCGNYIP